MRDSDKIIKNNLRYKLALIRQNVPYSPSYHRSRNPYREVDDLSWRLRVQGLSKKLLEQINHLHESVFSSTVSPTDSRQPAESLMCFDGWLLIAKWLPYRDLVMFSRTSRFSHSVYFEHMKSLNGTNLPSDDFINHVQSADMRDYWFNLFDSGFFSSCSIRAISQGFYDMTKAVSIVPSQALQVIPFNYFGKELSAILISPNDEEDAIGGIYSLPPNQRLSLIKILKPGEYRIQHLRNIINRPGFVLADPCVLRTIIERCGPMDELPCLAYPGMTVRMLGRTAKLRLKVSSNSRIPDAFNLLKGLNSGDYFCLDVGNFSLESVGLLIMDLAKNMRPDVFFEVDTSNLDALIFVARNLKENSLFYLNYERTHRYGTDVAKQINPNAFIVVYNNNEDSTIAAIREVCPQNLRLIEFGTHRLLEPEEMLVG